MPAQIRLIGLTMLLFLSACNLAPDAAPTPIGPLPPEMSPTTDHAPASLPASACRIEVMHTTAVYDAPGNWGNVVGEYPTGQVVQVMSLASNGWYGAAYFPDERLTYTAPNYAQLLGDCSAVERITVSPPLTACRVINNSGESQALRTTPEINNENYMGRFPPNESMAVIKQQGDWYMVYVEAFSSAAWINAPLVVPTAECAALAG